MKKIKKVQKLEKEMLEKREKEMNEIKLNFSVKVKGVNAKEIVLEVLSDENQNKKESVCELTVIPVYKPENPRKHYRLSERIVHKNTFEQFKLLNGVRNAGAWSIKQIGQSIISAPKNLINKEVLISNGNRVFRAKVIRVCCEGGGTTGPATQEGLPEVDE